MEIIFIMALCIGSFGSNFVKFQIAGIEMIYLCILLVFCYYVYEVIIKRRLKPQPYEWLWLGFIAYGCIRALLSLLGVTDSLVSEKLPIDLHFLPRHAYYLALLPVVLLNAPSKGKQRLEELIQNHNRELFFLVLLLNVVSSRSFYLPITTVFVLSFLSLSDKKHDKIDWLMFFLIMGTIVFDGIQLTSLLIRFIYAVCFLFQKRSRLVLWGLSIGIWCCIGLCFVIPLVAEDLSFIPDPNTVWRARFWQDELNMLAESHYLGVGYGTAYCSTDFIDAATYIPWGDGDPFVATAQHSVYDKVFVTGAHNSFVTVAFRLGIIGIGLFAAFLIQLHIRQLKNMEQASLRAFFGMCSGLVLITLNVGLESPYYMLLFLMALCISNYEVKKNLTNQTREYIYGNFRNRSNL